MLRFFFFPQKTEKKGFGNFLNTMLLKQFYKTALLEMPESSDLITEGANNIYIYPITCDLLRNEASRII